MKKFETSGRLDRESVCMSVVSAVPDFLTIEEAAAILRIGRTAAYALGREYLATGGVSGLPVMRFGRLLRVPRVKLEAMLGGPITWPLPTSTPSVVTAIPLSRPRVVRTRSSQPQAPMLPFSG
jgi:hypothetical protein